MFRILKTGAAFCDGTAMALGLLVLAAALAAQGGRFSARLDVLGHFARSGCWGRCSRRATAWPSRRHP